MPQTPEDKAREQIEQQLIAAGWVIQDAGAMNLIAGRGIAVREFPLAQGHGEADYLLYGDRKALGVIEAKKEGDTLTGVEAQTEKYGAGLSPSLPAWNRPLSFLYQSTGIETRFTNALDPDPRSHAVFTFHQPWTLIAWAQGRSGVGIAAAAIQEGKAEYGAPSTLLRRLRRMPTLLTEGMRPAQIEAVHNLERSLAENRPRALVQMTMGSGKTYTAVAQVYRLIKHAGVKRVLFLVDRGNLARQALREFQQYSTPDDGRKFTELYNVQHLQSNKIDDVCRVCITTIQRLYSILKGDPDFDPEQEEISAADAAPTLRTFKEKLFTEIFPGRTEVPKTLVFAKDDSHADDIVRIFREEFGKGNDFCEKITYRTSTARIVDPLTGAVTYKSTGIKPEDLLSAFRNSFNPRIAVTVDMIATGTDVKPLEIVFFLRDVKSANYFEQMLGRGSRVISSDDLQSVTPDARAKTRFVIVDAVGVCERERVDTPSLDRQPSVPLKKVLQVVGMGGTEEDVVSTLASRLARLDRQITTEQRNALSEAAGQPFQEVIRALVDAVDPNHVEALAGQQFALEALTDEQKARISADARFEAVTPFLNNRFRDLILDTQQDNDQVIDRVSQDEVLFAGASEVAKDKAKALTQSFAAYLKEHQAEITALQFLYSRPQGKPPTLKQLKELAVELKRPPRHWTPEALWQAYAILEKTRVHGKLQATADLISLVRFALEQETVLAPFSETVNDRFVHWLSAQEAAGSVFTPEQRQWLTMIRDHIAGSLSVEPDDFELTPFSERGGLGRASALFGDRLRVLLNELSEALTI